MEYVGGGCVSNLLRNPFCGPLHREVSVYIAAKCVCMLRVKFIKLPSLPPRQTLCQYSKQLLEALNYLHSQGIVHNDLQPSLVFLDGGRVKLGGFTIIKRLC